MAKALDIDPVDAEHEPAHLVPLGGHLSALASTLFAVSEPWTPCLPQLMNE